MIAPASAQVSLPLAQSGLLKRCLDSGDHSESVITKRICVNTAPVPHQQQQTGLDVLLMAIEAADNAQGSPLSGKDCLSKDRPQFHSNRLAIQNLLYTETPHDEYTSSDASSVVSDCDRRSGYASPPQIAPTPSPRLCAVQMPYPVALPASIQDSISSLSGDYTPRDYHYRFECWHAVVVQKSYGQEKRFMCPPPKIVVSDQSRFGKNVHGVLRLGLSINSLEIAAADQLSKISLPANGMATCSFKSLHVPSTVTQRSSQSGHDNLKVGHVNLKLSANVDGEIYEALSCNIQLISKPSKKVTKSKQHGQTASLGRPGIKAPVGAILCGDNVAFFNRINCQNVRTRYINVGQTLPQNQLQHRRHLTADSQDWTPMIVRSLLTCRDGSRVYAPAGTPIAYNTHVVLSPVETDAMNMDVVCRIVRLGKDNQVILDSQQTDCYVSQMHRVALQVVEVSQNGHAIKYLGTSRADQDQSVSLPLTALCPSSRVRADVDSLSDSQCWTIVGVSKFQC
ncbi:hypothetical protein MIR68_007971 [Amoeboaphelidium protococcarum]|nr:hypothetical protein MIR68_007971 [Amoeboaphelidium protococcarum]